MTLKFVWFRWGMWLNTMVVLLSWSANITLLNGSFVFFSYFTNSSFFPKQEINQKKSKKKFNIYLGISETVNFMLRWIFSQISLRFFTLSKKNALHIIRDYKEAAVSEIDWNIIMPKTLKSDSENHKVDPLIAVFLSFFLLVTVDCLPRMTAQLHFLRGERPTRAKRKDVPTTRTKPSIHMFYWQEEAALSEFDIPLGSHANFNEDQAAICTGRQ